MRDNTLNQERTLFDLPHPATRVQRGLERARQVLTLARVTRPPVDVGRLAGLLGVRDIRQISFASVEACVIPSANGHRILVEESASEERQRFSIAHELGHLMLRANGIRFSTHSNRRKAAAEERLCDELAWELLMPGSLMKAFRWRITQSLPSILELADAFLVPPDIAALRWASLGGDRAQIVVWDVEGDHLYARNSAGPPYIRLGTKRSLNGVSTAAAAMRTDDFEGFHERKNRQDKVLSLLCESKQVIEHERRYVVTLARDVTPIREVS